MLRLGGEYFSQTQPVVWSLFGATRELSGVCLGLWQGCLEFVWRYGKAVWSLSGEMGKSSVAFLVIRESCLEFVWGYGNGKVVWGLSGDWHESCTEDSGVARKTNKNGELRIAVDPGIEAASYDRISTKRGHRREEVMGSSDEEASRKETRGESGICRSTWLQ